MAAPFPYEALKAVADELLTSAGIDVVLQRESRSPAKSWEQDQGPASTSSAQSISGIKGVEVQLDKETIDLQATEGRLGRWALTAPETLPEEVGTEWELVANGLTYPIVNVQPKRPGAVLLLYFVVVRL